MIIIEEVKAEILELVIDWIYSGALTLPMLGQDPEMGSKSPIVTAKEESILSKQWSANDQKYDHFTNGTNQEEISTDDVNEHTEVSPATAIDEKLARQFHDLLDLYIFATTYDVRLLRLDVMKKWQETDTKASRVCGPQIVKRAFKYLPENSQLLAFIGYVYVSRWKYITDPKHRPSFQEALRRYPPAFGVHLANSLVNRPVDGKGRRIDYKSDPCRFHEHLNQEESKLCYALSQEEKLAPKRKHDAEVELPELKDRIATHQELWAQWETTSRRKKMERDGDNLFIKINN
jgi:hypothetical protein